MSPEDLKFLQDNAPDASAEAIQAAYDAHQGNLLEALSDLLKVVLPPVKEPTEWEVRRNIYDEMDRLAQEMLRKKKA
jgi:hypothetical protein